MASCYICDAKLGKFLTTPILELPNGKFKQCCEECADREFPNWQDEDEDKFEILG